MADHIAVVDDDALLRERLAEYLTHQGFRVTTAESAVAMRELVAGEPVDLAIIDLAMPGEDGLSLTRFLRERYELGIIILTGKGEPAERVIGLEVGADDYVPKPFHLRELLARVRSVLRRSAPGREVEPHRPEGSRSMVRFAGWRLDLAGRNLLSPAGGRVHLTTAEFELLSALVANAGRTLDRDRLLKLVAERGWEPYDRSIDHHISRLRRKLEPKPGEPTLIKTIRSKGYMFTAPVDGGGSSDDQPALSSSRRTAWASSSIE
ncbi:MAG TPA: response regulator [Geminicoccaceae bacterium]|nr:response regulator [Geminicoccaceae bacterium]